MRYYFLLSLLLALLAGCTTTAGKTGIVCSNDVGDPPVSWEAARDNAPAALSSFIYQSGAFSCINYDAPESSGFQCQGCSWVCASESSRFWRFTDSQKIVDVHIWKAPCDGTVLEYRQAGQGYQQGIKVPVNVYS